MLGKLAQVLSLSNRPDSDYRGLLGKRSRSGPAKKHGFTSCQRRVFMSKQTDLV